MKRKEDIILKRIAPLAIIIVLLVIMLGFASVAVGNSENPALIFSDWMSYISDDVLYADVIKVDTHNSGTVETKVGDMRSYFLDCQQGSIYDQLMYGSRGFDFRVASSSRSGDGKVHFAHGFGIAKYSVEDAFSDIKRFRDEHPQEFIEITMYWDSRSMAPINEVDEAYILEQFNTYLEPEKYAFPAGTDFSAITMGEMRASGKSYLIGSQWIPDSKYNSGRSPAAGTWTGEYSSGLLDSGKAMYDEYLFKRINDPNDKYLWPGFNRGSGDSGENITPLEFMLHDRPYFEELMSYLEEHPVLLNHIAGFCFDYVTYDYIQPGRAILLNALKGTVKPELKYDFTRLIAKSMDYTLPNAYSV
ncbi:MAG: hypothetical protein LBC13_01600 [Clostridiales bacterium]|jgi:hypothetical protein|nr:hypothetical protein [Clostridiales bacterium]